MKSENRVLALATDAFFVPQIEAPAKAAGFTFEWSDAYRTAPDFISFLAADPPALVVLDLNSSLPWMEWIPAAKADERTAGIRWLAFGSHMNPRRLAAARKAGAEKVVPKSQFMEELRAALGA